MHRKDLMKKGYKSIKKGTKLQLSKYAKEKNYKAYRIVPCPMGSRYELYAK